MNRFFGERGGLCGKSVPHAEVADVAVENTRMERADGWKWK